LKWYPADFRADPRVRMCSLAARGLWIELLGFMHEAEPYGFLLVAGVQPTTAELASLVGSPVKDVERAMAELKAKGVCGVDDRGRVYSRRMVRDREKSEADRAHGSRGGNPRLKEGGYPPGQPPGLTGGLTGGDKAQKPEARSQKPERIEDPEPRSVVSAQAPQKQGDLIDGEATNPRGTRLPEFWPLTEQLRDIAVTARIAANLPPIDIDTEHARFLDYWHAKAGADGRKASWVKTWRNWCRNARTGPHGRSGAFGEGMRNQIADAMTLIEPKREEASPWPALGTT